MGSLTHGAFSHQADELMRPRLSRHPQEDVSERVLGEPAVLWARDSVSVYRDDDRCGGMESEVKGGTRGKFF